MILDLLRKDSGRTSKPTLLLASSSPCMYMPMTDAAVRAMVRDLWFKYNARPLTTSARISPGGRVAADG